MSPWEFHPHPGLALWSRCWRNKRCHWIRCQSRSCSCSRIRFRFSGRREGRRCYRISSWGVALSSASVVRIPGGVLIPALWVQKEIDWGGDTGHSIFVLPSFTDKDLTGFQRLATGVFTGLLVQQGSASLFCRWDTKNKGFLSIDWFGWSNNWYWISTSDRE